MGKKQVSGKRGDKSSSTEDRPSASASASAPAKPRVGASKTKSKSKSKFGHDYSKDYSDPNWPYAKGNMDRSAWIVIILTPTIVLSALVYYRYLEYMREQVRTPLDAPKMIEPGATSALEDAERFWGTYRSGMYFGMKTRSPHSPVMGLMWMPQFTGEIPPPIRHW